MMFTAGQRVAARIARRATASLCLLALCATTEVAHAAGAEETVAGGVALGRAAAYGRADDFMAIMQNPANLAIVAGRNLGGELRLPIYNACFDRARDNSLTYREPNEALGLGGSESFANVCAEGFPLPTGNLGYAQSFDNGIGFGVGFFTPPGVARTTWGKDRILTVLPAEDEKYEPTLSGTEYPNRYLLLSRSVLVGWLMAGIGYQPFKQLRVGASFGAGFFTIENKNVSSVAGGFATDPELINDVVAKDMFVPRATASIVVAPTDSLEFLGVLTYQADVEARGHLDLTANGIQGAPLHNCRSETPGPRCRVENVTLSVPFPPLEATFGVRYAARRSPRERVNDPLKDERWDVALELAWTQTSHVKTFDLKLAEEDDPTPPQISFSSSEDARVVATPKRIVIPHYWRNTYTLRAGGDYNLIAEKLSVRAGMSYASNAVPTQYMNIDMMPVRKVGLHAGLTVAYGRSRLTLAYSHLFYQKVTVPVGGGEVREIVSQEITPPLPVNEGTFHASLDVISIQSNLSF